MLVGLGSSITDSIAAAITRQENANPSLNNPGDLMAIPGHPYSGQVGVDSRGFAIFDSYDSGYAQLQRQVDLNISRGLTLDQFFCGGGGYSGYAPGSQCIPYVQNVSSWTGLDANQVLADAGGSVDSTSGLDLSSLGLSDGSLPSWVIPAVAGLGILGIVMAARG